MKTFLSTLLCLLLLAGCSKEDPFGPGPIDDQPLETRGTDISYAPIIDPINGNQVIGQAKLIRQASGVSMKYQTSGLVPGHTYTIWWIVWDKPENCVGYPEPCDVPDFENPEAVGLEMLFAAGRLADQNGKANFSGHLNINDVSESINELFGMASNGGLTDPDKAEIHLVLRSHGPPIPGKVHEQISTYQGGCTTYLPDFTEVPDEEGECGDLHFAVFQAN